MVKRFVVLVLLFLGVCYTPAGMVSAHVEITYFLTGKVGKRDIALKMMCYDEMPTRHIQYFFADDKRDRFMAGQYKDKLWNFIADQKDGSGTVQPAGALNIAESVNGTWKGTWVDSTGKSRAITLQPMVPDSFPPRFSYLPYVTELDPYERYRLSTVEFTKTKTVKRASNLACDWYEEKESGIAFFRLRSAGNLIKTDSINAALETLHLTLVQRYFLYKPHKLDTKIVTTIPYLTNELVSCNVLTTTTFKTRNAANARQLITLDLASGLEVNLEDLVWFDPGQPKPPASDLFKVYKYRKSVFATRVFTLLQELYPNRMNSDSCNINKTESWALPAWGLTGKGIALSFTDADQCDVFNWAILPYDGLAPFMEKRYHLKPGR